MDTDTAGAGLAEGAALEDEMAAIEREMAERAALEGEGMLEMEGKLRNLQKNQPLIFICRQEGLCRWRAVDQEKVNIR